MPNGLNTGILLRKPNESAYAAYRRFLVANANCTRSELKQRIEQTTLTMPEGSNLSDRAAWLERVADKQLSGINILPAQSRQAQRRIYKNCPICAAAVYHSDIYETPWISHCPLHKTPLVDHCPQCQNPWPSLGQLQTRQCDLCGSQISVNKLIERAAFDWYDEQFEPLQWLHTCETAPKPCGFFSNDSERKLIFRQINTTNAFFSTYLAHVNRVCKKRFVDLLIPIEHAICVTTPLLPEIIPRESIYRSYCLTVDMAETLGCVRWIVLARIAEWIRSRTPRHHHLQVIRLRCGGTPPPCPYCITFTLWCYIVTRVPWKSDSNPFFSIDLVWVTTKISPVCTYSYQNETYPISNKAQQWLYFVQIWRLFVRLFQSVAAVVATADGPLNWEKLIALCHRGIRYNNPAADCVGFDFDGELLKIIFPRSLVSMKSMPITREASSNCWLTGNSDSSLPSWYPKFWPGQKEFLVCAGWNIHPQSEATAIEMARITNKYFSEVTRNLTDDKGTAY